MNEKGTRKTKRKRKQERMARVPVERNVEASFFLLLYHDKRKKVILQGSIISARELLHPIQRLMIKSVSRLLYVLL